MPHSHSLTHPISTDLTSSYRIVSCSIANDHALITHEKDKLQIKPSAGAKVVLNGNEIKDKKELHHNDR